MLALWQTGFMQPFKRSLVSALCLYADEPTVSEMTDEEILRLVHLRNWISDGYKTYFQFSHVELMAFVRALLSRESEPSVENSDEPVIIEEPEYHYEGMGCGLEDLGITDRYEAMRHGWDCAIERMFEQIPEGQLFVRSQPSVESTAREITAFGVDHLLRARIVELTEQLTAARVENAASAVPVGILSAEELKALSRFNETCEDNEGYDVPKLMMEQLASRGAVRWCGKDYYEITDFGAAMLKAASAVPGWKLAPSEPTECPKCGDTKLTVSLGDAGSGAPASAPCVNVCDHEWVSARNEVIQGGSICIKCYAMSAKDTPSDDHIDDAGKTIEQENK